MKMRIESIAWPVCAISPGGQDAKPANQQHQLTIGAGGRQDCGQLQRAGKVWFTNCQLWCRYWKTK
jgi:hypothetical protein